MPRNLPFRDEQRIQATVTRGALTPNRAEHWRVYAAAGHDISFIDHLAGGVVLPAAGTVAASGRSGTLAAASPPLAPQQPDDEAEYQRLFGSVEQGQRIADARVFAAREAVAALTDGQVYERMFGKDALVVPAARSADQPSSGRPVRDPLAASAAGRAGKHGRGSFARDLEHDHAPLPTAGVIGPISVARRQSHRIRFAELRGRGAKAGVAAKMASPPAPGPATSPSVGAEVG